MSRTLAAILAASVLAGCQPSRPAGATFPESGAALFTWGAYYDTDIEVGSFFGADHSLMVRFMPQYELTFEAPVLSNGSSAGVGVYSAGTEVVCLIIVTDVACPHDQLGAGIFLRLGFSKFIYAIPRPVPYMAGLEVAGRAPVPSPAVWRQLFLVRRGPLLEVWLDGDHLCRLHQPAASCDVPIGGVAPAGRLRLGHRVTGSNETVTQFYGLVDDVAVFDAALTAAELNEWFLETGGVAETSPRLRAGVNFDREIAGSGPRIRPPQTLSGPARIVAVSADHSSATDAPTLPIVAGTAPIELPFMAGKIFQVGQQFAVRGSHAGQAAFSWDFVWVPDNHPRGSPWTSGLEADSVIFIAGAEGTVIRSEDTHPTDDEDRAANTIDVRRTSDDILQYLHLKRNSALVELNDVVARADRLGVISNVGGGGPHLHFAVLDRIDQAYLTRPSYFVSYCVSNDFGVTWEFIEAGMPTNGQWVRRANTVLPAC